MVKWLEHFSYKQRVGDWVQLGKRRLQEDFSEAFQYLKGT